MIDTSRRVYFAKCIGPTGDEIGAYKIGCSYGHNYRVKALSANLPFTLEIQATVPGDLLLEAICHMKFREDRVGGEYFKYSEELHDFVKRASEKGFAFHFFEDNSSMRSGSDQDLVAGFLSFHGVTLDEACHRAALDPKRYRAVGDGKIKRSSKMIAGAALVAMSRQQFVVWPDDGFRGCLQEKYHSLKLEAA